MRQTSLDAYAAIKHTLSARRWETLCYVIETPGMSASYYEQRHNRRHINKRFSELERMGVIEARGESGGAVLWWPTGNLPRKLDKPLTWKQRAERLQAELDATRQALAAAKAGELMAKAELIALRTLDERQAGREPWTLAPTN